LRRLPAHRQGNHRQRVQIIVDRALSCTWLWPELRDRYQPNGAPAAAGFRRAILPAGRSLSTCGTLPEIRDLVCCAGVPGLLRRRNRLAPEAACGSIRSGRLGAGVVLSVVAISVGTYWFCALLSDRSG